MSCTSETVTSVTHLNSTIPVPDLYFYLYKLCRVSSIVDCLESSKQDFSCAGFWHGCPTGSTRETYQHSVLGHGFSFNGINIIYSKKVKIYNGYNI